MLKKLRMCLRAFHYSQLQLSLDITAKGYIQPKETMSQGSWLHLTFSLKMELGLRTE